MKKTNIEELILEYINAAPGSEKQIMVKSKLLENGYDEFEISRLKKLYHNIDEIKIPQLSENVTVDFYSMLETFKDEDKNLSFLEKLIYQLQNIFQPQYILRAAYSFVLIFCGWAIGYWLTPNGGYDSKIEYMTSELHEMKKMMTVSMLQQTSPAQRIKLVNSIVNMDPNDEMLISILLNLLNHDSNVNVRLVTVEALAKRIENNRVKEGLIYSLSNQESPLIQLALTDLIVSINEKQAIGELKNLLQRKELNDTVRSRIEDSLKILI